MRSGSVSAVEHEGVALGVAEERHLADSGVMFAGELDAASLEVSLGGGDVGHAQREG